MNIKNEKQIKRIAGGFEKHFRHFGYKKTVVDEVAAELGVSKKTIYHYFLSKEEIFTYIIREKANARRAKVEKAIASLSSPMEKLQTMTRINFHEFRKLRKKRVEVLKETPQQNIAAGVFRKTFFSLLTEIIHEGIAMGDFETCDTEMTARFIQAMVQETMEDIYHDADARPEEHLMCAMEKILQKPCDKTMH